MCDATLAAGRPACAPPATSRRWPNALFGEEMRVEHWTNAAEQGAARRPQPAGRRRAAASRRPYAPVPFFWSDQGRHRIQFLGRSADRTPDDEVEVVVGDPAEHRFLALYGRGDRLWGVLGANVPRLVMPYRAAAGRAP